LAKQVEVARAISKFKLSGRVATFELLGIKGWASPGMLVNAIGHRRTMAARSTTPLQVVWFVVMPSAGHGQMEVTSLPQTTGVAGCLERQLVQIFLWFLRVWGWYVLRLRA